MWSQRRYNQRKHQAETKHHHKYKGLDVTQKGQSRGNENKFGFTTDCSKKAIIQNEVSVSTSFIVTAEIAKQPDCSMREGW